MTHSQPHLRWCVGEGAVPPSAPEWLEWMRIEKSHRKVFVIIVSDYREFMRKWVRVGPFIVKSKAFLSKE